MSTRQLEHDGFRVQLDLSRQVLRLEAQVEPRFTLGEDTGEEPLLPTPVSDEDEDEWLPPSPRFVAAGQLLHKAKVFDDGLVAAVGLASQRGIGRFGGKSQLLSALARALADQEGSRAAGAWLLAACRLGGIGSDVPVDLAPAVEATTARFLANEWSSKPLGVYAWSPELERIFRQDRLLQQRLTRPAARALAEALRADPARLATYTQIVELAARLTNPGSFPDLRGLANGRDKEAAGVDVRFLPPARSHEEDLGTRLYGHRPIPDGFSLLEAIIHGIRAGTVGLEPTRESGWYNYQTWAHEPLVIPQDHAGGRAPPDGRELPP